jgi:multidrug efflux system outer membrane protein
MRRIVRASAPALLLVVAACSLAPKYERPAAPVEPAIGGPAVVTAGKAPPRIAAADLGWRDVFRDPRLQALVGLALRNNRDLRIAALNVELTEAQYRIQRASQLPAVVATGTVARGEVAAAQNAGRQVNGTVYTAGVAVPAFELDFFGRVRNLSKAALEQYFATEEARRSAEISLVAGVAVQYLSIRASEDQVALAKQTLEVVGASLGLTRRTYEAGRTSELDLRTAESQVQSARFNLSIAQRSLAEAQNALVLLVGQPLPPDLPVGAPLDAQELVLDVPAGLPSDVLLRRPDILSAEHALVGANAAVGAARAAFFPSITLTGSVGSASTELSTLFTGTTGFWSFVPQINVPIFQGGATKANLDVAKVRKNIQIGQYERAIQGAFREVADALDARGFLDDQLDAQQARVQAEQRRYDLSDLRYRKGVDSYLVVLTAQRDLYTAQALLIQSRFARLANLVDLYRALGGGWRETSSADAQPAAAPAAPAKQG